MESLCYGYCHLGNAEAVENRNVAIFVDVLRLLLPPQQGQQQDAQQGELT